MQQAIPYSNGRTWMPLSSPTPIRATPTTITKPTNGGLHMVVKDNPVVVVGRKGCCMCHVVRSLLLGLGVNPAVYEIEEEKHESLILDELKVVVPSQDKILQFPAVFIGGRHVGGLDRLMATHITGDLVPILKQAGALWL